MTPTNEFSRRLAIDPWPDHAVSVGQRGPCGTAGSGGTLRPAGRTIVARPRALERGSEPGELVLRGWLEADVVQACVISLEPVPARLRQRVERRYRSIEFSGSWSKHLQPHGMEVLADDEEEVEPVIGGMIELGEAIAEELGLALDPYPRAAGAARRRSSHSPCECWLEHGASTPFAALPQLREKHAR